MKELRVTFTDAEYRKLKRIKGKNSWHEFLISIIDDGGIIKICEKTKQ